MEAGTMYESPKVGAADFSPTAVSTYLSMVGEVETDETVGLARARLAALCSGCPEPLGRADGECMRWAFRQEGGQLELLCRGGVPELVRWGVSAPPGLGGPDAVLPLSWQALGEKPKPEWVVEAVEKLRAWANEGGDRRNMALWACFHPAVAEVDARRGEAEFNPFAIDDGAVMAARETLIQLRDMFLLPGCWSAENTVTLSHAIKVLYEVIDECIDPKPEGWDRVTSASGFERRREATEDLKEAVRETFRAGREKLAEDLRRARTAGDE